MKITWAKEHAEVHLPPLAFLLDIEWDEFGNYGPLEEGQEGQHVLLIRCEVWDVEKTDEYGEEVAREAVVLPDYNPETGPNGELWLNALAQDAIESMNASAHSKVRTELAQIERRLVRLRAVERRMSRVTLTHQDGRRITLTPHLAQMILAFKSREAQQPWRLQLEAPNLAACYNEHGILVGRIIYRPELETTNRPGRMGLYPYEDESESTNERRFSYASLFADAN